MDIEIVGIIVIIGAVLSCVAVIMLMALLSNRHWGKEIYDKAALIDGISKTIDDIKNDTAANLVSFQGIEKSVNDMAGRLDSRMDNTNKGFLDIQEKNQKALEDLRSRNESSITDFKTEVVNKLIDFQKNIGTNINDMSQRLDTLTTETNSSLTKSHEIINLALKDIRESNEGKLSDFQTNVSKNINDMAVRIDTLTSNTNKSLNYTQETVNKSLEAIQKNNEREISRHNYKTGNFLFFVANPIKRFHRSFMGFFFKKRPPSQPLRDL